MRAVRKPSEVTADHRSSQRVFGAVSGPTELSAGLRISQRTFGDVSSQLEQTESNQF